MSEPIAHLFDDGYDPKVVAVYCKCGQMVHCQDELMHPWFEFTWGAVCLDCLFHVYENDYDEWDAMGER